MIIKSDLSKLNVNFKKPIIPIIILISVTVIGIIGYMILWKEHNPSFVDAFYMVIITLTTVGYTEVYPTDQTIKLFTMFISITGISSFFYIFSVILENLVLIQKLKIRERKLIMKRINEMSDHYIIVGFGRVGMLAAFELKERNQDFVVISQSPEINLSYFKENEIIMIDGDATQDQVLKIAGIEKAKSLIVATGSVTTTLFVVLSAREINKNLNIIARTDDDFNIDKLYKAGANRVINPYATGGTKMAAVASNPSIVDFFDSNLGFDKSSLSIEIMSLPENCNWINKNIGDLNIRKITGVTIMAVIRNKNTILNPKIDFIFQNNDKILVFGTPDQIKKLETLFETSIK